MLEQMHTLVIPHLANSASKISYDDYGKPSQTSALFYFFLMV